MGDARQIHVLLIGGSLRSGSTCGAALVTARALTPRGATATIYDGLSRLPHFNPDVEAEAPPAPVLDLRAQLAAADAVMFSTPEYAGSLPGSFKNLLDWSVGEGLHDKPVGWINPSAHGGAKKTYEVLRIVLGYVNADVVEAACIEAPIRRDAIAANGETTDASAREHIGSAMRALVEHARARSS
jgi:NAD(P)H-dependent FMN reductase